MFKRGSGDSIELDVFLPCLDSLFNNNNINSFTLKCIAINLRLKSLKNMLNKHRIKTKIIQNMMHTFIHTPQNKRLMIS